MSDKIFPSDKKQIVIFLISAAPLISLSFRYVILKPLVPEFSYLGVLLRSCVSSVIFIFSKTENLARWWSDPEGGYNLFETWLKFSSLKVDILELLNNIIAHHLYFNQLILYCKSSSIAFLPWSWSGCEWNSNTLLKEANQTNFLFQFFCFYCAYSAFFDSNESFEFQLNLRIKF